VGTNKKVTYLDIGHSKTFKLRFSHAMENCIGGIFHSLGCGGEGARKNIL